jgi:hypothetical protein
MLDGGSSRFTLFSTVLGLCGVTILHLAFFRGRLRRARRSWHPLTSAFPTTVERVGYITSMEALVVGYAILTLVHWYDLESPTGSGVNIGMVATIVALGLELVVLEIGTVQAIQSVHIEDKIHCVKEGHSWKCSRMCSAMREAEAAEAVKVWVVVHYRLALLKLTP